MQTPSELERPVSAPRAVSGGVLMGLANLVPGVSGGTMILALGLYERFIAALSDLTRLRLRGPSLLFLAWIGAGAIVAILGMSGPAVYLVTEHRWVMYSLFVGMTLGGAPDLLRQSRPLRPSSTLAFSAGLGLMAYFAFQLASSPVPVNAAVLIGVGALAASSMILPGISGSYILLVFGLYDVVIGSLRPGVLREEPGEALWILLPFALGAAAGIALLSNALRALLARHSAPTHAALLGLLLGSVLGLWPFQEAVHPELVDRDGRKAVEALLEGATPAQIEARTGVALDAARAEALRARYAGSSPGDLRARSNELRHFRPTLLQIASALALFAAGFALTRRLRPRERT